MAGGGGQGGDRDAGPVGGQRQREMGHQGQREERPRLEEQTPESRGG